MLEVWNLVWMTLVWPQIRKIIMNSIRIIEVYDLDNIPVKMYPFTKIGLFECFVQDVKDINFLFFTIQRIDCHNFSLEPTWSLSNKLNIYYLYQMNIYGKYFRVYLYCLEVCYIYIIFQDIYRFLIRTIFAFVFTHYISR